MVAGLVALKVQVQRLQTAEAVHKEGAPLVAGPSPKLGGTRERQEEVGK